MQIATDGLHAAVMADKSDHTARPTLVEEANSTLELAFLFNS